jgi:hypothetical protein
MAISGRLFVLNFRPYATRATRKQEDHHIRLLLKSNLERTCIFLQTRPRGLQKKKSRIRFLIGREMMIDGRRQQANRTYQGRRNLDPYLGINRNRFLVVLGITRNYQFYYCQGRISQPYEGLNSKCLARIYRFPLNKIKKKIKEYTREQAIHHFRR